MKHFPLKNTQFFAVPCCGLHIAYVTILYIAGNSTCLVQKIMCSQILWKLRFSWYSTLKLSRLAFIVCQKKQGTWYMSSTRANNLHNFQQWESMKIQTHSCLTQPSIILVILKHYHASSHFLSCRWLLNFS